MTEDEWEGFESPHEHKVPAEALEHPCSKHPNAPHGFNRSASHSADRYVCECEGWEALEQPTQEPVDVARVQVDGSVEWRTDMPDLPTGTKLYTHPPKEWQGLSDDDIDSIDFPKSGTATIRDFTRVIEAKLKEKNT